MQQQAPALQCPYCHYYGPPRITNPIAPGGCVWFCACLLIGLVFLLSLWPVVYAGAMGEVGALFVAIGFVGLFITRRTYSCARCGIKLGR